jgi:hypothetical protein
VEEEITVIVNRFKLPNGNTLIWLGNQPIHDCENILILAGKEVLFLKTVKQVSISDIRKDMAALGRTKFYKNTTGLKIRVDTICTGS